MIASCVGCDTSETTILPPDPDLADGGAPDATTQGGPDGATASPGLDAAAADESPPDAAGDAPKDGAALSDGGDDGGPAPPCTPYDASALDPAAVTAGQMLTVDLTPSSCVDCHNDDLSGGRAVGISGAFSRNLTPDPATGLGCWSDSQIVTAILYGATPDGGQLCVMPRWSDLGLDASAASDIVQYLRSLPAVSKVVPDTVCPATDGGPADSGTDGAP